MCQSSQSIPIQPLGGRRVVAFCVSMSLRHPVHYCTHTVLVHAALCFVFRSVLKVAELCFVLAFVLPYEYEEVTGNAQTIEI